MRVVGGRLRGRAIENPARVEEEAERLRGASIPVLDELRAAESPLEGTRRLVETMLRAAYGLESPPVGAEARDDLRRFMNFEAIRARRCYGVTAAQRIHIELAVNGRMHALRLPHQRTLLLAIREDLGLTGTKKSCNLGQCGACTVLMDGLPVYSCMILALDATGHDLTTIEGIGPNGGLHPVQDAFVRHMGSQCGHCTPGMILPGVALIERTAQPTPEQVRQALSGTLCRCGNYRNEIAAVLSYIRTSWGNDATPISALDVQQYRAKRGQ